MTHTNGDPGKLLLGAVAYDPKVVTIWDGFKAYFVRHGLPFDYVLFSDYERQVEALMAGQIHVAWNSPLAWVRAERMAAAQGRHVRAIAMRDSDRDLASVVVVRAESPIGAVADLKGKIVAVGALDSPQATLLPLAHLADLGLEPETDFTVERHDLLVGKHGDHIGGERDAARALIEGKVDAACMIEGNLQAFIAEGTLPAGATRVLLRTPRFDHCNFTASEAAPEIPLRRFQTLLMGMSYDDPEVRPYLDMEGLKAWNPGRTEGYRPLEAAVDRFHYYAPDGGLTRLSMGEGTFGRVGSTQARPASEAESDPAAGFQWKMWIYTNFDCNLRCSYCCVSSGPDVPRRALSLTDVRRLVDEAVGLGFDQVFFTGGEPLLNDDIYDMLAYASARVKTTVLTNGMLLKQRLPGGDKTRIDRLVEIARGDGRPGDENLIVQVSLDGGRAEDHDAYRGKGSWARTVEGIRLLQERGFRVRLATTETPVNSPYLGELCAFHRSLGIPDEDHFIRPLAKRGFSSEGLELSPSQVIPEITVNVDGVFWHPLSDDADMLVSRELFPLAESVQRVQARLDALDRPGAVPLMRFT